MADSLKQKALNEVNAGESWIKANKVWLVVLAAVAFTAFVLGMLTHL